MGAGGRSLEKIGGLLILVTSNWSTWNLNSRSGLMGRGWVEREGEAMYWSKTVRVMKKNKSVDRVFSKLKKMNVYK